MYQIIISASAEFPLESCSSSNHQKITTSNRGNGQLTEAFTLSFLRSLFSLHQMLHLMETTSFQSVSTPLCVQGGALTVKEKPEPLFKQQRLLLQAAFVLVMTALIELN